MASRQSKRSLTFPLRPLDNTFSKSGGLILSGVLISSCCDDSFTAKPREQGELPTGAVLVKVDFFRVARHPPTTGNWEPFTTLDGCTSGLGIVENNVLRFWGGAHADLRTWREQRCVDVI